MGKIRQTKFRKTRAESSNFHVALYTFVLTAILGVLATQGVDVSSININNLSEAIAGGNVIRIAIALPNFISILLKVKWKEFSFDFLKSKNWWAQIVSGAAVLFFPETIAVASVALSHGTNTGYHLYRDGASLNSIKRAA